MMISCLNGWNAIFFVSQDCMLSLFVMIVSLWKLFWEYKTEFFWHFYVSEVTDVVVNSIAKDVWGSEDELTGALGEEVDSWYWVCL